VVREVKKEGKPGVEVNKIQPKRERRQVNDRPINGAADLVLISKRAVDSVAQTRQKLLALQIC
jgi:hypothetical protein